METEGYTDDGKNKSSWSKEYGFEDIIIQQETKKLLTDFMKMDKEYSEALKDRDVAVRLYNDIDKVIQGKLDELSITDKNLKLLETKLDRENYELKNDKALGDILNDLGCVRFLCQQLFQVFSHLSLPKQFDQTVIQHEHLV